MKVGDKVKATRDFFMQTGSVALRVNKEYCIKDVDNRYFYIDSEFAENHAFPISELLNYFTNEDVKDSIVESVISQYRERSEVGIKKYNNTMDRKDLSTLDWLTHLQQEMMDATLYIEKLKNELK